MHKNINGYVGFIFVTLVISSVVGVARGLPIEQIVIRSIIATAIIGAAAYGLMRIGRRFLPELTGFGRSSESADETHPGTGGEHASNEPDSRGTVGNTVDMVVGDDIDIISTDEHSGESTAPAASAPGAHDDFSENTQEAPAPDTEAGGIDSPAGTAAAAGGDGGGGTENVEMLDPDVPTDGKDSEYDDDGEGGYRGDRHHRGGGHRDSGLDDAGKQYLADLAARPKEAAGVIRTILEDR